MKNKMKKVLLRAMLTALSVSMILCAALILVPQKVSAATAWGLQEVTNGTYVLGTGGIQDPTKVETDQGYYMEPGSYIYYGTVNGQPILWRVLDKDNDNTGASGAMFLFSEDVFTSARFSASWDDEYLGYNVGTSYRAIYFGGKYENTYNGSYMESYEYAIRNFVTRTHYSEISKSYNPLSLGADALNVYELSAIRQVTKDDSLDLIENGFGYVASNETFLVHITEYTDSNPGLITFTPANSTVTERYYYTLIDSVLKLYKEVSVDGGETTLVEITNGRELSFVLDDRGIPTMMLYNQANEANMPWETNVYVLEPYIYSSVETYTATRCYWVTSNLNFITLAQSVNDTSLTKGDNYTSNTLENSYIFPLSVAELEQYVANYQSAPGLAAHATHSNTFYPWILRTAYDNDAALCDCIGYVTADGKVTFVDADTTTGVRYGINVEKDHVIYSRLVDGSKTWSLALIEPVYDSLTDEASKFDAHIVDVIEGVDGANNQVTVEYKNAISRYFPQVNDGEDEYISAMVIRNGEVRYYGTVGYAPSENLAYNTIDTGSHQVTFDIPADFDQTQGDKLYVFWERKNDNSNATTFTSNMVEMDCVHVEETAATCNSLKVCASCGEEYGSFDPDNHSGTLTWVESQDSLEHWQDCTNCDAEIGREACEFTADCTNVTPCECGRDDLDPNKHAYDDRGICEHDNSHFEAPQQVDGFYQITKSGHLMWVAEQVNDKGNTAINVKLMNSLSIDALNNWEHGSIGTAQYPYGGTFDGNGNAIEYLEVNTSELMLGFFGYTNGATIQNLTLKNLNFSGENATVGALIGEAKNTTVMNCTVLTSKLNAADEGIAGALVGTADAESEIVSSFAYEVKDASNVMLPLVGSGEATLTNSFYLTDTANDNGGRTAEQFASGEVAYALGKAWGQTVGTDTYPMLGDDKVYRHTDCVGAYHYSNNELATDVHSYTEVLEFVWNDEFTECNATVKCANCDSTVTIACDDNNESDFDNVYIDYFGNARAEYYAQVMLPNGSTETSERVIFIVTPIEDTTAVEPITKTFDGQHVSVDEMLTNTRLKYGNDYSSAVGLWECEAFFVPANTVTKETLSSVSSFTRYRNQSVTAAGVYDLVLVGKNNYLHQVAIFEDVLTIEKAKLTLQIDVYDRPEDGTTDIEYDVYFEEETDLHLDWLEVSVSKPDSPLMGTYTLTVSLSYPRGTKYYSVDANDNFEYDEEKGEYVYYYDFDGFKESVELTYSETVTVNILRNTHVSIEDNGTWAQNYRDTEDSNYNGIFDEILITYGTDVPIPTAADFTLSEGSTLKYEWYEYVETDSNDYICKKLNSVPVNVGDYVLRVIGTATGDYVESYIEIDFSITRKPLTIIPENPSNFNEIYEEIINEYENEDGTVERETRLWYVLDYDDPWPDFTVEGLVYNETLASAGISTSTYAAVRTDCSAINSLYPNAIIYEYRLNAACWGNYLTANTNIYVVRQLPTAVTPDPATYSWDGIAKSVTVKVAHPASTQIPQDGQGLEYQVEIAGASSEVSSDSISQSGLYFTHEITQADTYTAVVKYNNDIIATYTYTVTFTDAYAAEGDVEQFAKMVDVGKYTVTVTTGTDPETAVTKTAEVNIQRELRIYVKETQVDLDSTDKIPFDIKNLVFEAGYLPMLGHTIEDLEFSIDADRYHGGEITVCGWTILDANGNDVSDIYTIKNWVYAWTHNNGGLNVCHIYDNACDATCNVYGCDVTRAPAPHTGGTATCQELAICEVCGLYYGNYDAYNHTSEATLYVPDQYDSMLHHHVHACCGEVIFTEEHHADVEATCTDQAICTVCNSEGVSFGDLDPHNHTSTEYTYVSNGSFTHQVYHTCCNAFVGNANHGGGDATCKTLAVCEHCGTSYGDFDEDDHERADEATYTADGNVHVATYPCCGAVVREAHSGGEATCTEKAVCQHCNTAYGETDPLNHASTEYEYTLSKTSRVRHDVTHACCGVLVYTEGHSGGEATCIAKATCQHCGTEYGFRDLTNHAEDTFVYQVNAMDPTMHDKLYACCEELHSTEAHSGGEATCEEAAHCESCDAHYGETADHIYSNDCDYICNSCEEQTREMTFHTDEDGDEKCDHCEESVTEDTQTDVTNGT